MTAALRQFLLGIHQPYVLASYPNDLRLLKVVLIGFEKGGGMLVAPYQLRS